MTLDGRVPAIIALVFLAAAAAPPTDCTAPSSINAAGRTLPTPQDLAGRPIQAPPLGMQNYATLPPNPDSGDCQGPVSAVARPNRLRDDEDEVLHGLPSPEILRPMDETKKSPYLQ